MQLTTAIQLIYEGTHIQMIQLISLRTELFGAKTQHCIQEANDFTEPDSHIVTQWRAVMVLSVLVIAFPIQSGNT